MLSDARRLSIALAGLALAAAVAQVLMTFVILPAADSSPASVREPAWLMAAVPLPVTTAACVAGAITVRRQRRWFVASAIVAAILTWSWFDPPTREPGEYLVVILPLCLLPLLIVLETMALVRSVNALRDPLRD